MAKNTTKTLAFSNLDIIQNARSSFVIDQYSTLNEKFSIGNVSPPSSGYPEIKYLTIGRGGHQSYIGSNNASLSKPLTHGPANACLFEHIPFVLVPVTNDLTTLQRANYRIRVLLTINSIPYYAYYLKVIDISSLAPATRLITLSNGSITSDTAYTPTSSNLNPTPVDVSNINVMVANGSHLIPQASLTITLNADDIASIINACTIIYGGIEFSTISEMGLVGGFDTTVTSTLGGNNVTYTEIQTGQIMTFIQCYHDLQYYPSSITIPYTLSDDLILPPNLS